MKRQHASYLKVRKEKQGFTAMDTEGDLYIIDGAETPKVKEKFLRPCLPPTSWDFSRPFVSPILIKWDITYKCNLNCVHCYSSSTSSGEYGLSTDLCKRIIDILDETGVFKIQFLGGEPTCREDHLELINYAKQRRFNVCLNTNATLISGSEATKLKCSEIDSVQVGLDGIGKTNDSFRGSEGAFERTIRGIENLVSVGLRVGVVTVLNKTNIGEIMDIVNLCSKLGVDNIQFLTLACSGRGADATHLEISMDDRLKCRISIEAAREKNPHMAIDSPGTRSLQLDQLILKGSISEDDVQHGCDAGTYSLELDPYGDLHLCLLERSEGIGNVLENNPYELFEEAFRLKERSAPSECKKCGRFLLDCWGHCLLHSF
jgi:MoaA/NifB/PqqE/SkfB family radical SAM enzyme